MEHDPQMERSRLLEVIRDFVKTQSLQTHEAPKCPHCGQTMCFLEATVWQQGSDSGCIPRLPSCVCDQERGTDVIANASSERASFTNPQIESAAFREC